MLTPCFDVTQDDAFIIITMRVPFAKTAEAEFCIDGTFFKFYCKPYFLRLCLPGELVEDGRERAVHDIEKGTITVYVPKLHAGLHFENLGMITSLLSKKQPTSKMPQNPLIEVLPGAGATEEEATEVEEEEFDWQIDQEIPVEDKPELLLGKRSSYYGFAEQHSAVLSRLQQELPALVDCPDPDGMTGHERRVGRLAHEEASFNSQHYLADLMDGAEMIEALCQFQPPWSQQLVAWTDKKKRSEGTTTTAKGKGQREPDQDIIPFTDDEKVQLKELPNKEYLLDKATRRTLYLGLVDIIFAYAYDYRITEGEHNVESAWNICKLSSTLSWLEVFRGSVEEVIYCSARRCLCYPLYRHWQLVQCVLHDTTQLFLLGRRKLLQCLLDVRRILNSSEPYYVMNNLYITDYCVWIQRASSRHIQNLALELKQVKMEKNRMGWELAELEQAARLVAAEGDDEASTRESGDSSSDEGGTESSSSSETDSDSEGETERNTTTESTPRAAKPATESTSDAAIAARNTRESLPPVVTFANPGGVNPELTATVPSQSPATCAFPSHSTPTAELLPATGGAESGDEGPHAIHYNNLNPATKHIKAQSLPSLNYNTSMTKAEGTNSTVYKDQNPATEDGKAQRLSPLVLNHTSSAIKAESQGPASTLCKEQNPDIRTVSPLNNTTSTTEHSRDRVVEELSEGLCSLLTLRQPPSPLCPAGPTTSPAGRNLIEELN